MQDDLLKILSDSNKEIDNQKLMDYLSGKLSDEQKHEVEKWIVDNPFFAEAMEGLQQAENEKKVKASVEELNGALHKFLAQRKKKRQSNFFQFNYWAYIAVVFILALAVLVYYLIKSMK